MRQAATASMADAVARRSVCRPYPWPTLSIRVYPWPTRTRSVISDMCVRAILKIAAVVEYCGIEPVEWDKRRLTR